MASLRFTYDGERRQERRTPVYPFQPRFMYPAAVQRQTVVLPIEPSPEELTEAEQSPAADSPEKEAPKQEIPKKITSEEVTSHKETSQKETLQKVALDKTISENRSSEKQTVSVSERFISRLESVETGLDKTKGHVDALKVFSDEVVYKLESGLQIMAILRANEERRLSEPQVQLTSTKTSRDTIDDLLALLQTPAVQSVLRQIMVGLLVKK